MFNASGRLKIRPMNKTAIKRYLCSSAAVLLSFCGAATHAQVRWDLATGYPDTSFHVKNLREFAADVSARTNGQVVITVHSGGSLVKAPEIRNAVTAGTVAAGEVFGPSMGAVHPVFALDAIPLLSTNYANARRLWNLSRPLAEKKAADTGVNLLYSVAWPPQGLFSAKEIHQVNDFKGVKLRENSPAVKRLGEILEADTVTVETPDLVSAVQAGKVTAVFTSAAQGVDTKLWEKLPWFYPINAWLPRNIVMVNRKKLDELPAASRDAVIRAAAAAEERGWSLSERSASETLTVLKNSGAKIGVIGGSVRPRLDRAGGILSAEAMKRADPELFALLTQYLALK
jgi:TRAP-type C4-dicarboxylate transport system substrate-binding protein